MSEHVYSVGAWNQSEGHHAEELWDDKAVADERCTHLNQLRAQYWRDVWTNNPEFFRDEADLQRMIRFDEYIVVAHDLNVPKCHEYRWQPDTAEPA
jgi:hypothetical protein